MAQVLTVLLNRLATSHHSSSMGVAWLLGCLVAGWAYTAVRAPPFTPPLPTLPPTASRTVL